MPSPLYCESCPRLRSMEICWTCRRDTAVLQFRWVNQSGRGGGRESRLIGQLQRHDYAIGYRIVASLPAATNRIARWSGILLRVPKFTDRAGRSGAKEFPSAKSFWLGELYRLRPAAIVTPSPSLQTSHPQTRPAEIPPGPRPFPPPRPA